MKAFFSILIVTAIVYAAYQYHETYIKPKPAAAAPLTEASAPQPAAVQPPANPEPVTAPAPAVASAPAPVTPAPPVETVKAPEPPPPAGPVQMICQTDVQAFDPNSPLTPLGWFKAGSELEVSDCPKITGMKNVSFKDPSGKSIQALCFEKDLNRTSQDVAVAASAGPKSVVEKPKPMTFKPKKWGNEPNWQSVYDDPNHHMMTDKDGNTK